MLLGLIGASGFVLGRGFFAYRPVTENAPATDRDRGVYLGGWLIMLVGIAASIVLVARNVGLAVFSQGYLRFLELSSTTMLGPLLGLANLGCLFAICGAKGREWMKPLAVWGVFLALPVLILGARSGPMISLVGFAVALSYGGVRLNRALLAGTALVSLVAIPAIESFRTVGFANRSGVNWTDVTPVDTLTELGGSLRATMAYVEWIEKGDSYLFGATYWAPFDRQILTRLIPGREPIPVENDVRVPQRLMDQREGNLGGSATGEGVLQFRSRGSVPRFWGPGSTVRMAGARCRKVGIGSCEPGHRHVSPFFSHPRRLARYSGDDRGGSGPPGVLSIRRPVRPLETWTAGRPLLSARDRSRVMHLTILVVPRAGLDGF